METLWSTGAVFVVTEEQHKTTCYGIGVKEVAEEFRE